MDVPVWGGFFASILLRIHGSKTYFFGGILISDTQTFESDGQLSCFCDMQMYICYFPSSGWTLCVRRAFWEGVVMATQIFCEEGNIRGNPTSLACCLCSCLAPTDYYCRNTRWLYQAKLVEENHLLGLL